MANKAPMQAPEGTPEPIAAPEGTDTSPDDKGPQIDTERSIDSEENTPESFDRAYVESLRNEAKENRQKAARADYLETEVRRLAIREATRGVLTDPEALTWNEDFLTADGLPDHDALKGAAEALAAAKPWLSRPRGDIAQGQHGTGSEGLSLSALLRG